MTTFDETYNPAITTGLRRRSGALMLVDDEPALLTVGRAILSTLNLRVDTASSGEEALEKLATAALDGRLPDVIMLDLTMPGGMSGLETLEQIRQRHPGIAVVACSGFFGDGAEELCQHVGFADMLAKPYTPEALVTVVRRVMVRASE